MPVWKKSAKPPKGAKPIKKAKVIVEEKPVETIVATNGGSLIESIWGSIQPDPGLTGRNDPDDAGAWGFMYPWSHDLADGDMLRKALPHIRPKIILELGTFEARGTVVLAEAAKYQDKVTLYTFDIGHSPVNSLGPTYGAPPQDEVKIVDWKSMKNTQWKDWTSWEGVMEKREKRFDMIRNTYPNLELIFIEGFTYDTLPDLLPNIEPWDFCFQDTLHHINDIMKEWVILKPFSKKGSIIVIDDMIRETVGKRVVEYFDEKEPTWKTQHGTLGRQMLWAERIK